MHWFMNLNYKQSIRNHNSQMAKQAFKEHKEWLYSRYPGKYVLICETQMVDVYDSYEKANKDGLVRFGEKGFLIQRIH